MLGLFSDASATARICEGRLLRPAILFCSMFHPNFDSRAAGVAIETLSSFAVGENALAGIVLGYGGIATTDIQEGLRRLGKCFGQLEPGGTTTPL
jgi:hypothetical protein